MGTASHVSTQVLKISMRVSRQVCNTKMLSRKVPFHYTARLALHPVPGHRQLLKGCIRAARLLTPGDRNVHFLAGAPGQLPIYLRALGTLGAKQKL